MQADRFISMHGNNSQRTCLRDHWPSGLGQHIVWHARHAAVQDVIAPALPLHDTNRPHRVRKPNQWLIPVSRTKPNSRFVISRSQTVNQRHISNGNDRHGHSRPKSIRVFDSATGRLLRCVYYDIALSVLLTFIQFVHSTFCTTAFSIAPVRFLPSANVQNGLREL